MLCSAGLFAVFSSTISKSPVLPLFASHLGADPAGVGTVAAVSAFTGVVASVPAGMLSDRVGRKRMLIISAIIFSSAPFLYQFASTLWHLAVIRFYHGFATAIFVPVAMALVSDLFHGERGEKMGWFSTSTLLGRFMAPIIGGVIIGSLAFNPGLGYRVVYLVCGVAGIIAFFLTLKLPDPGNDHGKDQSWRETFTILRGVMSNRVIVLTSAVEASILFAYGTFETFLPLYAVRNGISAYEVGLFLSSQVITLALTQPVMGRFSDRHGRRPQIVAGAFVGACCIGSFSLFTSFIPLLALSVLFGLSLSVVTSATSAFIADQSGRESHGSAMGMLGSIMDIGHTMGPFVSGIVAGHLGFGASFLGASLILVIVSLIFLITIGLKDNKEPPPQARELSGERHS